MTKQLYDPPVTYWCFCPSAIKVYPIAVVAETELCVWVKPDEPADRNGREHVPHVHRKHSMQTFHSFYEAKEALTQQLRIGLSKQRLACRKCESRLERALALAPPTTPSTSTEEVP